LAKIPYDPTLLPIDSIAGEAAPAPERLAPDWMRARFAAPPAWQPEQPDRSFAPPLLKRAAVLVPLVRHPQGLAVLLTRRTEHLSNHGGQVSFPGGRAEQFDSSPIETALRESAEEIGLHRRHVEIIGVLPDLITGTGYRITPVIGLLTPPFELVADPSEVAEIFEVPLAFLMDGVNHQRKSVLMPDRAERRHFYAMPYQDNYIWGATAAILRNLFHFLRA
jgi:8-oxo-dGTP pyrophosphatase MutT (NUDIX family)